MISIERYKTFHGDLIVKPVNGNDPFTLTGDWLYKPNCDCWYGGGQSFPADICEMEEVDMVAKLEALQLRYKEAMELLEVAISNINKLSVCECCEKRCQGDDVCIDNGYMYFSWRHADCYKALKAQENGGDMPQLTR